MKFVASYKLVLGCENDQRRVKIEFVVPLNDVSMPTVEMTMPYPVLRGGELVWNYAHPFTHRTNANVSSKVMSIGRYLGKKYWDLAPATERVLHPIVYVEVVIVEANPDYAFLKDWARILVECLRKQQDVSEFDVYIPE